jgi:hypothetical protein
MPRWVGDGEVIQGRRRCELRWRGIWFGLQLQRTVDFDDQWDHVTEAQLSVMRVSYTMGLLVLGRDGLGCPRAELEAGTGPRMP